MKAKHLLVLISLLCTQESAAQSKPEEPKPVCNTYRGTASEAGMSNDIYVHTNAFFCVSDGKNCSSKGGQLFIKNVSENEFGTVTSEAAGLHDWPIKPKDVQYHTLAVYTKPGQPIVVDLSVTWCRPQQSERDHKPTPPPEGAVAAPVPAPEPAPAPNVKAQAVCSRYGALADCERLCTSGSAWSCVYAGYAYYSGEYIPRDRARSQTFMRKACNLDLYMGCIEFALGGQPADSTLAQRGLTLAEKACIDGDGRGCWIVGVMHYGGVAGLPADRLKGLEYQEKGCRAGYPLSCLEVVRSSQVWMKYPTGLYDIDEIRRVGIERAKKLCNDGEHQNCDTYIVLLNDIDRDPNKQWAIAKPACDNGMVPSCCLIAAGQFPQGSSENVRYFRLACRGSGGLTPGYRYEDSSGCRALHNLKESF